MPLLGGCTRLTVLGGTVCAYTMCLWSNVTSLGAPYTLVMKTAYIHLYCVPLFGVLLRLTWRNSRGNDSHEERMYYVLITLYWMDDTILEGWGGS